MRINRPSSGGASPASDPSGSHRAYACSYYEAVLCALTPDGFRRPKAVLNARAPTDACASKDGAPNLTHLCNFIFNSVLTTDKQA